jgi:hypothetical protein
MAAKSNPIGMQGFNLLPIEKRVRSLGFMIIPFPNSVGDQKYGRRESIAPKNWISEGIETFVSVVECQRNAFPSIGFPISRRPQEFHQGEAMIAMFVKITHLTLKPLD